MKVAKKAAGVAAPLSMLAGPEAAPVAAALGAFSGSGKGKKKKATVRKTKKPLALPRRLERFFLILLGKKKKEKHYRRLGR